MKNKVMSLLLCALMVATVFAMTVPNASAKNNIEFHEYYDFSWNDEGFDHVDNDPMSDVHWDQTYQKIYFESDRDGILDERMEKVLPDTLTDTSGDWELSVDFNVSEPGWWAHAYPLFIGEADNSDLRWDANQLNIVWERSNPDNTTNAKNHIIAFYRAANGIHYDFLNYDAAELDTIYRVKLSYDVGSKTLRCDVIAGGISVKSGEYVIGTNPNDGFKFGKLGVSANGIRDDFPTMPYEQPVIGWSDNIKIDAYPDYGNLPGNDINPKDGVYMGITLLDKVVTSSGINLQVRAGVSSAIVTEKMNEFVWEFTITEGGMIVRTFTETTSSSSYDSFRNGRMDIFVDQDSEYSITVEVKGTFKTMNNVEDPTANPGNNNQIVILPIYMYLGSETIAFET